MEKEKKSKNYVIKMPVFATTSKIKELDMYGSLCYSELVELLKSKLKDFKPISSTNRNQTTVTVIDSIEPIEVTIGNIPSLLLKVSSYMTNIYDGYFESKEKIVFDENSRIGSVSN